MQIVSRTRFRKQDSGFEALVRRGGIDSSPSVVLRVRVNGGVFRATTAPTIHGSRGRTSDSEGRESIPPLRNIARYEDRVTRDKFSPGLEPPSPQDLTGRRIRSPEKRRLRIERQFSARNRQSDRACHHGNCPTLPERVLIERFNRPLPALVVARETPRSWPDPMLVGAYWRARWIGACALRAESSVSWCGPPASRPP